MAIEFVDMSGEDLGAEILSDGERARMRVLQITILRDTFRYVLVRDGRVLVGITLEANCHSPPALIDGRWYADVTECLEALEGEYDMDADDGNPAIDSGYVVGIVEVHTEVDAKLDGVNVYTDDALASRAAWEAAHPAARGRIPDDDAYAAAHAEIEEGN